MAAKKPNSQDTTTPTSVKSFIKSERVRVIVGLILLCLSIYAALTLLSFIFTGGADQSKIENLSSEQIFKRNNGISNWGGTLGAFISDLLINKMFGLGSLFAVFLFGSIGAGLVTNRTMPYARIFITCIIGLMWTSLFFSVFFKWWYKDSFIYLGGQIGDNLSEVLCTHLGIFGTVLLVLLFFVIGAVIWSNRAIQLMRTRPHLPSVSLFKRKRVGVPPPPPIKTEPESPMTEIEWRVTPNTTEQSDPIIKEIIQPDFEVVMPQEELEYDEVVGDELVEYDPTLDLSNYKYPSFDLLPKHDLTEMPVKMEELSANKQRITEVLRNFGIEITSIKATPGPTVTLYEIVPEAGIRIAKIRNLEDDIALSLSALGIRIIAPIPGKGTIGIEVPNKEPQIVPMRAILASEKFQNQKMELPIALGKTITNETFIVDLCKMPHVLVAGATGQGKSVGLNAIITSLLYKKHPSQLKFVLIDPKKVEFPIYAVIEKHFLAKLPDGDDAIITDVHKVVKTLTSLTTEMDQRYDLLNKASVRNVKEYNTKFIARKLNPENGHRFMPYIVVIIDEFGDLIMTAGKEIELPIARIAQLARAVGIHMVIATQRPSTNIITGTIKANFPARVAFRVSSMIDSRTILDCPGANQLIGRGDMLVAQGGGDLVRVQCAFIDTPEVEAIAKFIGDQRGYPTAYELPEVLGEEGSSISDIDLANRDPKFEDAARLIVATQQGSTSFIQRKMELGYNRAGRIMDQLEAAGIVGPSEGSKPRQVLVMDEIHLEMVLRSCK